MIVFLHGVPETSQLWDKVRSQLGLESVALSLPGFGCARPEGFGATKEDYVDWLVEQLGQMDGPVDLVSHDWGALITYRVATTRGELLRSWTADVANGIHPDAVWHEFAKIWQTPGDGEAYFETMNATPPQNIAPIFEGYGVGPDDALLLAQASDETMGSCILDLYRSAVPNVYASWGKEFAPTSAPGMVLHAAHDQFGNERMSREMAAVLGARHETLEGVGHWWAYQDPAAASAVIAQFIASID